MLKLRLLTAIILIPLVLLAIFKLPQPIFVLVAALVILLAAWEWAALLGWVKPLWRLLYVFIMLLALGVSLIFPPWISFVTAFLWWTIALIWIAWVEHTEKLPATPKGLIGLIGVFVLVPCWQALIVLHLKPKWLLLLLVMVWVADISAYFGGRWFGKTKLATTVSPNKTWEGVYAAMLMVALVVIGAHWLALGPLKPEQVTAWLGLTFTTTVAAIVGDLFESLMKRQQGLKDSGQLLPGHGGILDRIDSLTAAAPIFICCALVLKLL